MNTVGIFNVINCCLSQNAGQHFAFDCMDSNPLMVNDLRKRISPLYILKNRPN